MTDIVERAYIAVSEEYCQGTEWCWSGVGEPLRRFADIVVLSETEALRAENARLREAIVFYADETNYHAVVDDDGTIHEGIGYRDNSGNRARAAMGETEMKYVVYDPADFPDLEVKEGDDEPKKWTLAHRVKTLEAEILRLRKENARVREALKPFLINHPAGVNANDYDWLLVKPDDIRRAQAVIREGGENAE